MVKQATNLGIGPSIHTHNKTKKSNVVPMQDVKEIMEMHDKVIKKDVEVERMLKELL